MATTATSLPPQSAISSLLQSPVKDSPHPPYFHKLATSIVYNLQYQHDWTDLRIHTHSPITSLPLPRPLVSGLPPKRAYIHPDEQVELLKAEHETGEKIDIDPEHEWVLPTHLAEKWSLAKFAAVFDGITTVPPLSAIEEDTLPLEEELVGQQWRGDNRQKRILLATLHPDSTVVYYIMHDGLVKPRQN